MLGVMLAVCIAFTSQPLAAQRNNNRRARPHSCDDALARLDNAALDAREDSESYIIVLARLGDGEKLQSLNRRRLDSAIPHLESKAGNKIVAASGDRVRGYGRLELYVRGKLLYFIAFPRNRLIDCSGLG